MLWYDEIVFKVKTDKFRENAREKTVTFEFKFYTLISLGLALQNNKRHDVTGGEYNSGI